jgi:uncharacterized repeat protein (TIGR03803 family)
MFVGLPPASVAVAGLALGGYRQAVSARGWHETVLHEFRGPETGSTDGANPMGPLLAGPSGTFYGTTYEGGPSGAGTVFSLAPTDRGSWKENVLYAFTNSNGDGGDPEAGVHFGPLGVLYGTTQTGGAYCNGGLLCIGGTVFALTPPPSPTGDWSENVLISFYNKNDGGDGPRAGVLVDQTGTVFGATQLSHRSHDGTAFALTHSASGWTENVLHAFPAFRRDGFNPGGDLIADADGALYGTTTSGGTQRGVGCVDGCGVAFKLYPRRNGWREAILHSFGATGDGTEPLTGLLMSASGAVFGTTYRGGDPSCGLGCGVVFELQPPAERGGAWAETILHTFSTRGGDGTRPLSILVQDASGALYGTTTTGGSYACGSDEGCGTIFKLSPPAKPGGAWSESVLYRFTGTHGDGWAPESGVIQGADGSLYGTTYLGGMQQCPQGCGTVFKLSPR